MNSPAPLVAHNIIGWLVGTSESIYSGGFGRAKCRGKENRARMVDAIASKADDFYGYVAVSNDANLAISRASPVCASKDEAQMTFLRHTSLADPAGPQDDMSQPTR